MGILSKIQDTSQQVVDDWLALGNTTAGAALHIGAIYTGAAIVHSFNNLVYEVGQIKVQLPPAAEAIQTFLNTGKATIDTVAAMFRQPSIEGIPIITTSEQGSMTADISENPLIVQSFDLLSANTTYITDNAVPHPREWTLQGHLVSMSITDRYFVVKPSITLQRTFLVACMRTRRPVWFKTFDNTFVQVMIKNFTWSYDPRYMNAMQVTLQLKEFVQYNVADSLTVAITGTPEGVNIQL